MMFGISRYRPCHFMSCDDHAISPRQNGLVKPNSLIKAAICPTCACEWMHAFRTYGKSLAVGHCATLLINQF